MAPDSSHSPAIAEVGEGGGGGGGGGGVRIKVIYCNLCRHRRVILYVEIHFDLAGKQYVVIEP